MKQVFFLFAILFGTAAYCQDDKTITNPPSRETRNPSNPGTPNISLEGDIRIPPSRSFKCCSRIYYSAAPAKVGGKTMTKTLTANPFKGKNRGVDLTFDFLDPNGAVVPGLSEAITVNGAGDIVVDGNKLPKGKRYRLRAKAGKLSETYILN